MRLALRYWILRHWGRNSRQDGRVYLAMPYVGDVPHGKGRSIPVPSQEQSDRTQLVRTPPCCQPLILLTSIKLISMRRRSCTRSFACKISCHHVYPLWIVNLVLDLNKILVKNKKEQKSDRVENSSISN